MIFGEFYPSPGGRPFTTEARKRMTTPRAFTAEVVGTAVLLLVIFCVTDERNKARPQILTAATIGLTVTLLISLLGPLTMACFNPARDFAPRLFSSLVGWGRLPFQVNGTGWLTVYIIAPLLGGLLGGGIYRTFFKRAYETDSVNNQDKPHVKLSSKITLPAILVIAFASVSVQAAESDLIQPLVPSVKQAVGDSGCIEPSRKTELQRAAAFIRQRMEQGKSADLTFVCTANSRRSHLAQIWAQTAAAYYGLPNVTTYSGGTEVAACNIRTIRALRRAGFSIVQSTGGINPVYLAQYSETRPAVKMYSKVYSAEENPQKEFAALFCCDQAAESCPVVKGAGLRLPIPYVDPKASDNSPAEEATYDERSRQIAREMFYLMSAVKEVAAARASR
jgi:hypothetical protein